MVIHLVIAGIKKKKSSSGLCPNCGYAGQGNGIVKTCLDCFLDGQNLHVFEYSSPCKLPDEIIKIAIEFFQGKRDFDSYNFASNNCENFTSYCKTGYCLCSQRDSFIKYCLIKCRANEYMLLIL